MIKYWRFVPFISRRMLVGWGFNLELSFQRSFVTGWGQLKGRGCPNAWSRLSWFLWNQVSEVDGWGWVRGLDLFEAMVTNTDSLLLSVPLPEECELNENFMVPCHIWFCNWTWIAEGKGVLECFSSVWVCETSGCPGWWCVLIFEVTCLLRWPWAVGRTLKSKS